METAVEPATGTRARPHRRAVFHLLRVSALDRITDDAVAITFDVPEELRADYQFVAGQHVSVRCTIAGDDVRRSYSICTPATTGPLRIGVKGLPDGVFSRYALERLQVGDSIEVLTPSGSFTTDFDPSRARHYGAVAAGSGITPVLSILATALEVEPHSQATLIFLNKSTSSIMFLEELEDLKNRYLGRLQIVHVLDGERHDVELLSGTLDRTRFTGILDRLVRVDDVADWFLCGPLGLTDSVRDVLVDRGVDPACVHRELFQGATPAAGARPMVRPAAETTSGGYAVEVVLDGRASTLVVAPDGESILDATLSLRGDAPYACKNGVCGTCRMRVLEGTVSMDQNFALEPDELARGFALACQSHPTSERVVVDFDQ